MLDRPLFLRGLSFEPRTPAFRIALILTKMKLGDLTYLRQLPEKELSAYAQAARNMILQSTKEKEGHIRSSFGVAELTVALHYFFRTPEDLLIWDVGHQAYIHKVITDRAERFTSNRRFGGLSGFTNRTESPFDPFGAGHSSTSLSALSGFWKADQLSGRKRALIAVIGDGAITGGMSFEALNYLGQEQANCWVILNDNQSSIDANVGGLQRFGRYQSWAESLGFHYSEIEGGNDPEQILAGFRTAQDQKGPRFIRICTEKGKGYSTGIAKADKPTDPSFQDYFAQGMERLMAQDERIVVLSPAMLSGAKLLALQKKYPERVIDVGIAEQQAVTMAAGLAAAGYLPYVHLYATFLIRALDQLNHDVLLQELKVVFCLDRAGIVGADGATHHGLLDQTMLRGLPHLDVWNASSGLHLEQLLNRARLGKRSVALRYPKAETPVVEADQDLAPWRFWQKGKEGLVISTGLVSHTVQAALQGRPWAHLQVARVQPLALTAIRELAVKYPRVLCVEEQAWSGSVAEQLAAAGLQKLQFKGLPSAHLPHGSRQKLLAVYGLDQETLSAYLAELK